MTSEAGRSAADLLDEKERAAWAVDTPWPTGFATLDRHLAGGFHSGELTLLGGAQGLGKTTLCLQMARGIAFHGGRATYLCYEHTERQLLERLVTMEVGLQDPYGDRVSIADVRRALTGGRVPAAVVPQYEGRIRDAVVAVQAYGDRLRFVRGSGSRTGLRDVAAIVEGAGGASAAVFVDYLQKVPVPGELSEDERVTQVVERLKDLALEHGVPIVAIVAADKTGLGSGRTRLHDLRGSTALAYEADVALLLNDKHRIVARHHLVFGTPEAAHFDEWVVCTIEKNRSGRADVDIEFHKRFDQGCFDDYDRPVTEQLLDERINVA